MIAGDSKLIEIACVDSDDDPLDLTGAQSVRWWMAPKMETPIADVPVKKDLTGGIAIVDPASSGVLQVTISPADTETLTGTLFHEAEVTMANGAVLTVYTGKIRIKRGLVR